MVRAPARACYGDGMRALPLLVAILAFSTAALAQESPPPPPLDPPPPAASDVAPLVPAEAPPPVETPSEEKPPDFTPAPPPKVEDKKKAPPVEEPEGGWGGAACMGAMGGCLGGGCLPGAATAVGATILISMIGAGLSEGGCGGVILVVFGAVYGIVIGAPGALLLGPCSACPAATGGVVGAWIDDRDVWPVVLGSIPGLVLAALGTAGTVWGLASLDGAPDLTVPAVILGSSAAVSLLSGPVTVAGVILADGMAEPPPPAARPADEKRVPKPDDPRQDPGKSQVAMRY